MDLKNQHLFISGENSKNFVTIDLRAGTVLHTTALSGNPRKPFFDPKLNEVWVDLNDNTLVAIDATTFEVAKTVEFTGGKSATKGTPTTAPMTTPENYIIPASAHPEQWMAPSRSWTPRPLNLWVASRCMEPNLRA